MKDEGKQLVELMMGDAEARLKRMKTSAVQVAHALMMLREAQQQTSDAVREYMSASGVSKTQLIADLELSSSEARLLGLLAPPRSRARQGKQQSVSDTSGSHNDAVPVLGDSSAADSTDDPSANDTTQPQETVEQDHAQTFGGQWHD